MSELFISYAREDIEFVRRLHDQMIEHGRSVWVDWEGIAPSAEWLDEINVAIDASDTFVQVLSPNSTASTVCQLELDRAARDNKRLIAIVCRDVAVEAVPETLAQVNWIFLREDDDFDLGVQALITALDTDLDWARIHTRLLVRAVEWDRRARPRSLCLGSRELSEHENWLSRIADKQPLLTGLQRQYLSGSRRTVRRRQIIVAATVVATAAGGAGLWWNADRQTQISQAQRIVADANAAQISAPARPSTAIMLAVEGMKRLQSLGVTSPAADSALRNAMRFSPTPIIEFTPPASQHQSGGWVQAMAFTDDHQLVALYSDERINFWREESPSQPLQSSWPKTPRGSAVAAGGGAIAAVLERGIVIRATNAEAKAAIIEGVESDGVIALSPNGELLATSSSTARLVTVWDVGSAIELDHAEYGDGMETTVAIAVSSDGQRVAMVREERLDMLNRRYEASVLDMSTEQRQVLLALDSPIWSIALSHDGSQIAVPAGQKGAIVFDAGSGRELHRFETGSEVKYVGFTPDGAGLVTVDARHLARVWHLATGIELLRIGGAELEPPVVFSQNGSRVAIHQAPGTIRVYAARVQGDGLTLVHDDPVNAISADGRGRIATASGTVEGPGVLTLWDAATGNRLQVWPLDEFEMGQRVTLSGDGRLLMLGWGSPVSCQGRTRLWDLEVSREVASIEHLVCGTTAALSLDGRYFAYVRNQGPTEILDLATGETTNLDDGAASFLAFNNSAAHLAAGFEDGRLRVWGSAEWDLIAETTLDQERPVRLLALDSRGARLAATTGDQYVTVWEVGANSEGRVLAHLGSVLDLDFSADGKLLATGASDGLARIWEFATGDEQMRLAHAGAVNVVAFGEDSATVATASEDETARLWALPGGIELVRINHGAPVNDLTLPPGGDFLVTAGRDGTVRRWLLRVEDLLAEACLRLGDDLQPETWDDHLRGRLTAPICE